MRLLLAFRAFFGVLFSRRIAERAAAALEGESADRTRKPPAESKEAPGRSKEPARSDALTLLAALQREARFVDFVMEPLEGLTNEQIGAAARDVHRQCAAVVGRMFAVVPLVEEQEQAEVDVPAGFDASRYRLTGNVTGSAPYRGRLMHPGWRASKCEVPQWSGTSEGSRVIAPAEIEVT